jgi:hypothetical protein
MERVALESKWLEPFCKGKRKELALVADSNGHARHIAWLALVAIHHLLHSLFLHFFVLG